MWGVGFIIMSLCSGYEQHFVTGTKLTNLKEVNQVTYKKTWPTISSLNNKTHSLLAFWGNFVG